MRLKKIFFSFLSLFLLAINSLIFYFSWRYYYWLGDGSIAAEISRRLYQGEKLYQDLFTFWMPGPFYLLQTAYQLLGFHPQTIIIVTVILWLGITVSVFLLSFKLLKNFLLAQLSLLFFLAPFMVLFYSHNLTALFFNLLWITAACFWPSLIKNKTIFLLGLGSGITLFFNQWQGMLIILAFLLLLLKENNVARQTILLILGTGSSLTFFLIITLARPPFLATLKNFFYAVFIFPLRYYHQGNMETRPYQLWWVSLAFYLIYFLQQRRQESFPARLLSRTGFVYLLGSLISPGAGHVSLGLAWSSPLFFYFLQQNLAKFNPQEAVKEKVNWFYLGRQGLLIFISLAFILKLIFNSTAKFIFLAQEKQLRMNWENYSFFLPPSQAQIFSFLQDYWQKEKPQQVFVGPSMPFYYLAFQLKNPTRYSHLDPGLHQNFVLQEIVASLERKNVQTILFFPQETAFDTYRPFTYRPQPLTRYLTTNFQPLFFNPPRLQPRELNDALWLKKK